MIRADEASVASADRNQTARRCSLNHLACAGYFRRAGTFLLSCRAGDASPTPEANGHITVQGPSQADQCAQGEILAWAVLDTRQVRRTHAGPARQLGLAQPAANPETRNQRGRDSLSRRQASAPRDLRDGRAGGRPRSWLTRGREGDAPSRGHAEQERLPDRRRRP
jgi:hypothetical protein